MEFFNTYGTVSSFHNIRTLIIVYTDGILGDYGYTSWEFPEMVTREKPMINDSDGRNYPWYGSSHQVVTINGPINHVSKYTVTMRDFFHPWLAAMNLETKDIYILRTVEWKKIIEIAVDPKRQRGRRSMLVSDPSPEQPMIYDENLPIPTCALYPPTANSAQVLVWRPISGHPTLVVPPKSIEINTTNYAHLPLARY
ncbi:unnamed protein product [Didymodactylos carnosus]|uniref:Uncharacterized protein n=2 Tax=Didymodactylos carnosus TaxID=1234261 RepID=A0A813UNZ6_9BILA|nr:unnamed protein product [Didymodactylos carnosus]CAF3615650.1 unnamed protein product [Didymodactylos carnosus]